MYKHIYSVLWLEDQFIAQQGTIIFPRKFCERPLKALKRKNHLFWLLFFCFNWYFSAFMDSHWSKGYRDRYWIQRQQQQKSLLVTWCIGFVCMIHCWGVLYQMIRECDVQLPWPPLNMLKKLYWILLGYKCIMKHCNWFFLLCCLVIFLLLKWIGNELTACQLYPSY